MSRHVKKYAAPRSWNILRKDRKFIKKPLPGAANFELGQSLNLTLRQIGIGKTAREIKRVLANSEVLIDGRRVRDSACIVGVMGVLSLMQNNTHYRMMVDSKGRLVAKQIDAGQAGLKVSKIIKKTMVRGGKTQLNFGDGRNMVVEKDEYKVGDSLVLSLPDQKIKEHLPVEQNAQVLLLSGKQAGASGVLTQLSGNKISYTCDDKQNETLKEFAIVIGPSKILKL